MWVGNRLDELTKRVAGVEGFEKTEILLLKDQYLEMGANTDILEKEERLIF